jgi:cell pole-organizing protein PopZ
MTQAAKAQEPSMEEILASIRRIIADDDAAKPGPKLVETPPKPAPAQAAAPVAAAPAPVAAARAPAAPAQEPGAMNQEDIDAVLAGFDKEPPEPAKKTSADVLDLTEAMEAKAEAAPSGFRTIEANSDVVFADRAAEPQAAPKAREPEPAWTMAEETFERPPLLSHNAQAAVTTAFGSLAHTVLAQNARTLDDLVRDMLRPMLKSWLDDNLPTIVERMVRAEIERVSRGRGG